MSLFGRRKFSLIANTAIALAANKDSAAMQVNVTTTVNSKSIRKETHNGREHWVVPSFTLPANVVMNGILYPAEQIDAHYQSLEGKLAPLGHPTVNGQHVSASSPEGLNTSHVGAWNRNVEKRGNRIYVEKWVDIETAANSAQGRRLLERLEALNAGTSSEPIHTSAALFIDRTPAPDGEMAYNSVARIHDIDHDAILLDEPGAATPEQGVGLMVNADSALSLQPAPAISGETFRQREALLDRAARAKFAITADDYVYVHDFTNTHAVLMRNGKSFVHSYAIESGKVIYSDSTAEVTRAETWVAVVNKVKSFFQPQAAEAATKEGNKMPMTAEERAALVQELNANNEQKFAAINDSLATIASTLKANADAAAKAAADAAAAKEAPMRAAVAEAHGEVVANALTGEALQAMFDKLTPAPAVNGAAMAAPLLPGISTNAQANQMPGLADHFAA